MATSNREGFLLTIAHLTINSILATHTNVLADNIISAEVQILAEQAAMIEEAKAIASELAEEDSPPPSEGPD